MRFGIMAAVGMLAASAGMAHGERDSGKSENRGLSPIILLSIVTAAICLVGCQPTNDSDDYDERFRLFGGIVEKFKERPKVGLDAPVNEMWHSHTPTLCVFEGKPYYMEDRQEGIIRRPQSSDDVEWLVEIVATTTSGSVTYHSRSFSTYLGNGMQRVYLYRLFYVRRAQGQIEFSYYGSSASKTTIVTYDSGKKLPQPDLYDAVTLMPRHTEDFSGREEAFSLQNSWGR